MSGRSYSFIAFTISVNDAGASFSHPVTIHVIGGASLVFLGIYLEKKSDEPKIPLKDSVTEVTAKHKKS